MNISLNLVNSGSKAATPVDGNQMRVKESTNKNGFKNLLVNNINGSQQNSNFDAEKLKEDNSQSNSSSNRSLNRKKLHNVEHGGNSSNSIKNKKLLKNSKKGHVTNAESDLSKLRKEIEELTRELSENNENDSVKLLGADLSELIKIINFVKNSLQNSEGLNEASIQRANGLNKKSVLKINDFFKKIANAKSLKEVKKALEDLDSLLKDPKFKNAIEKILNSNSNQDRNVLGRVMKRIPRLVDRIKKMAGKISSNNSISSERINKELKNVKDKMFVKKNARVRLNHREIQKREQASNSNSQNFQNSNHNETNINNDEVRVSNNSENTNNTINNSEANISVENRGFGQHVSRTSAQVNQNTNMLENPREIFNQIVKNVKIISEKNKKEMTIDLNPPELGKIKLKLTMESGKITARFAVENKEVHEMIEQNRSELTQQLQNSGLRVDNVDVQLSNPFNNSRNLEQFFRNIENEGVSGVTGTHGNMSEDNVTGDTYFNNTILPDWLASEVNVIA